jgi:hypothetical protein
MESESKGVEREAGVGLVEAMEDEAGGRRRRRRGGKGKGRGRRGEQWTAGSYGFYQSKAIGGNKGERRCFVCGRRFVFAYWPLAYSFGGRLLEILGMVSFSRVISFLLKKTSTCLHVLEFVGTFF